MTVEESSPPTPGEGGSPPISPRKEAPPSRIETTSDLPPTERRLRKIEEDLEGLVRILTDDESLKGKKGAQEKPEEDDFDAEDL